MVAPSNSNGVQLCLPHRARLSVTSCGSRWTRAQVDDSVAREQYAKCRECSDGKRNAGGAA